MYLVLRTSLIWWPRVHTLLLWKRIAFVIRYLSVLFVGVLSNIVLLPYQLKDNAARESLLALTE